MLNLYKLTLSNSKLLYVLEGQTETVPTREKKEEVAAEVSHEVTRPQFTVYDFSNRGNPISEIRVSKGEGEMFSIIQDTKKETATPTVAAGGRSSANVLKVLSSEGPFPFSNEDKGCTFESMESAVVNGRFEGSVRLLRKAEDLEQKAAELEQKQAALQNDPHRVPESGAEAGTGMTSLTSVDDSNKALNTIPQKATRKRKAGLEEIFYTYISPSPLEYVGFIHTTETKEDVKKTTDKKEKSPEQVKEEELAKEEREFPREMYKFLLEKRLKDEYQKKRDKDSKKSTEPTVSTASAAISTAPAARSIMPEFLPVWLYTSEKEEIKKKIEEGELEAVEGHKEKYKEGLASQFLEEIVKLQIRYPDSVTRQGGKGNPTLNFAPKDSGVSYYDEITEGRPAADSAASASNATATVPSANNNANERISTSVDLRQDLGVTIADLPLLCDCFKDLFNKEKEKEIGKKSVWDKWFRPDLTSVQEDEISERVFRKLLTIPCNVREYVRDVFNDVGRWDKKVEALTPPSTNAYGHDQSHLSSRSAASVAMLATITPTQQYHMGAMQQHNNHRHDSNPYSHDVMHSNPRGATSSAAMSVVMPTSHNKGVTVQQPYNRDRGSFQVSPAAQPHHPEGAKQLSSNETRQPQFPVDRAQTNRAAVVGTQPKSPLKPPVRR